MSNHFINHSVYSSRPALVESPQNNSEHLMSAPFLIEAKKALHTLENQHLKSEMGDPRATASQGGDGDDEAIGYGFLVEAKLALYKLENEYSKLQELESEITKQMYTLTNHLAKGLSDQTYSAMHLESEQMKTDAYGKFASGFGQLACMGLQGYQTKGIETEEKTLAANETTLREMDEIYEDPEAPRSPEEETLLSTRPRQEEQTETEEEIQERITARKDNVFEEEQNGKIAFNKEKERVAAQKATEEERTKIRENIQERRKIIDRKLNTIGNRIHATVMNAQMAGSTFGSVSGGIASMVTSSQKNEQAVSEANKVATNTAQSMINPSDAYKAMDGFQQDALNVLKIIEAIEQANKYQPAH